MVNFKKTKKKENNKQSEVSCFQRVSKNKS